VCCIHYLGMLHWGNCRPSTPCLKPRRGTRSAALHPCIRHLVVSTAAGIPWRWAWPHASLHRIRGTDCDPPREWDARPLNIKNKLIKIHIYHETFIFYGKNYSIGFALACSIKFWTAVLAFSCRLSRWVPILGYIVNIFST